MDAREADAAALRRELRSRLGLLGTPLQLLAEDVLGEEDERIDWVAAEPDGRLCVVLLAHEPGGERLLASGLAQRAWMQARIPDWQQLVPGLGVRADLRPHLLLLAPDFSRVARRAAREADPDGLRLARYRWDRVGGEARLIIEPVDPIAPARPAPAPSTPPLVSVFRSGLAESDFAGSGGKPERV